MVKVTMYEMKTASIPFLRAAAPRHVRVWYPRQAGHEQPAAQARLNACVGRVI